MSQEQAILDMLAPGRWISTSEILRAVPSIVHSRIASLRDKGFDIEHRRVGPGARGSEYRLVTPVAPVALANEITALVAEGILEPTGGLVEGRCGGPSTSSLVSASGEPEPGRLPPIPAGRILSETPTPAASEADTSEPEQLPLEAA